MCIRDRSIRFILFGLMAPFAAALLNRYGLRNVTLTAQLIVVSALVLSLGMTEVWQLVALWGVVIGIGTGMTALVLGATIATRWFAARRGLVIGIMTASVATGQLVFLPLLASLTERFGWRLALGFVCIMLGVSATASFRAGPTPRGSIIAMPPRPASAAAVPPPRVSCQASTPTPAATASTPAPATSHAWRATRSNASGVRRGAASSASWRRIFPSSSRRPGPGSSPSSESSRCCARRNLSLIHI